MKFSLIFLFFTSVLFSQNQYPKDYFISPLTIPLQLSGSFGELRGNHFHSGLDFKTQQKTGLNVYAAADGYVSRIKVSTWGYGKALYITHPNGYTTVYGHLLKYSPQIETYVKKMQYAKKSFEVEMFPSSGELKITKGDIIALSGNSGGSGGPHLHFEFRDSKTEKIINPLCFGFDVKIPDTKKPSIIGVIAYPLGDSTTVNKSSKPIMVNLMLQKDGTYIASKILAQGKIGFGINTYDTWDNNYNKNGIYKVQTFLNGSSFFGYQFETFAFNESRYVNALIDYSRFKRMNQRYQRLFMTTPYPLSIIETKKENGIIDVKPDMNNNYRIEVSDYNGNTTVVSIPIEYDKETLPIGKNIKKTNYFIKAKNDYNYRKDNVSVFVPSNTFYEDFYVDFDVQDGILIFGEDTIAVHKNITISFDIEKMSKEEREKTFIASVNGKKISYNSTFLRGNSLSAKVKTLGKFTLAQDTIAPKIKAVNFTEGKWLSNQSTLELEISDSMSGIKSYNAYLNGKWALIEYDYKTKKIIHYFDDNIVIEGRNDLKVVVTDNIGNSATFETYFFRSQKQ